jgi:hypothetical protein
MFIVDFCKDGLTQEESNSVWDQNGGMIAARNKFTH